MKSISNAKAYNSLSKRTASNDASAFWKWCHVTLHFRQYRTKSVWRLCTPSACKFPVIFHKNAREYIKYSLRFLFHLTKNLTTHLSHNLCAVLPLDFFQKRSPLYPAFSDKKYRTPCTEYGICMQQQKAGITAALIPESVCPPASPVPPAVS